MDLDSRHTHVSLDATRTLTSGTVLDLDSQYEAVLVHVIRASGTGGRTAALVDIDGPNGTSQRKWLKEGTTIAAGSNHWKVSGISKNLGQGPDSVTLERVTPARRGSRLAKGR